MDTAASRIGAVGAEQLSPQLGNYLGHQRPRERQRRCRGALLVQPGFAHFECYRIDQVPRGKSKNCSVSGLRRASGARCKAGEGQHVTASRLQSCSLPQ